MKRFPKNVSSFLVFLALCSLLSWITLSWKTILQPTSSLRAPSNQQKLSKKPDSIDINQIFEDRISFFQTRKETKLTLLFLKGEIKESLIENHKKLVEDYNNSFDKDIEIQHDFLKKITTSGILLSKLS